jgi:hypothetical protein
LDIREKGEISSYKEQIIEILGCIALNALIQQRQLIINGKNIDKWLTGYPCYNVGDKLNNYEERKDCFNRVLKSGFLKSTVDTPNVFGKSYYFIHFTLQEYFAAYYVANFYNEKQLYSFINEYKYNANYQGVFCFLTGLISFENEKVNLLFNTFLEEPKDLDEVYILLLSIRCLGEINDLNKVTSFRWIIENVKSKLKECIINSFKE